MSDSAHTWEGAVLWLRAQPDQAELVRACFYDDPLLAAAERYYRSSEWAAARQLLPADPGCALDIGAGRGISAYALSREGWRVAALEPDPSAVVGAEAIRGLARDAGLEIEVVQEWGERLPFADASFELVHCRQALHHARDLTQLTREIARVLRPGGRFVALREHVISRKRDLPAFQDAHPLHHLYGGERAYLLREYENAIRAAGLRLTAVLNPLQSDINLYPRTQGELKRQLAQRLHLPIARLVPDGVLHLAGYLLSTPGRLYSFVAERTPTTLPAHG
jgi:SAM-dependent methyltransferase